MFEESGERGLEGAHLHFHHNLLHSNSAPLLLLRA